MIGEGSQKEFLARQIPRKGEKIEILPIDECPKDEQGKNRLDPRRILDTRGSKIAAATLPIIIGGGVGVEAVVHHDNQNKNGEYNEFYNPDDFFQESQMEDSREVSGYPQNLSDFFSTRSPKEQEKFEKLVQEEIQRTAIFEFKKNPESILQKHRRMEEDKQLVQKISRATGAPMYMIQGVGAEESGWDQSKKAKKTSAYGIFQFLEGSAETEVINFITRVDYLEKERENNPTGISDEDLAYLLSKRNEMQSILAQARNPRAKRDFCYRIIKDKENNILIGAYRMEKLLRTFNGDMSLAILAQHDGVEGVNRAIKKSGKKNPTALDILPFVTEEGKGFLFRVEAEYRFLVKLFGSNNNEDFLQFFDKQVAMGKIK